MKIYSTALFGDGDKYAQYLRAWVRGVLNLFPQAEGWRLFLALDNTAWLRHERFISRLWARDLLGFRLIMPAPLCQSMLKRMSLVFNDLNTIDYVFCRDLDSPPMPRDRACCDAFIASKATVHTVHDSDQHIGILGGLCGFFAPQFRQQTGLRTLDDLIAASGLSESEWGTHGADQIALNRICLRPGGPTLLEHRYNGWWNGPGARPAKSNGEYPCASWSAKVPDAWPSFGGVRDADGVAHAVALIEQADRLGAHLGCAGYDHEAAVKFWDEHGDPDITAKIAECEK